MRRRSAPLLLGLVVFACVPRLLVPYRTQKVEQAAGLRSAIVEQLPDRMHILRAQGDDLELAHDSHADASLKIRGDLLWIEADPQTTVELTLIANQAACQRGYPLMRAMTDLPDQDTELEVVFATPTPQDAEELMSRIAWTHAVDRKAQPNPSSIPLRGDAWDLVRASEELAAAACEAGVTLRPLEAQP